MKVFTHNKFLKTLWVLKLGVTAYASGKNFYRSIGISDIDAQTLESTLAQAMSQNVSLVGIACKTAELALSRSQVNNAPLDQTIVDENWSQAVIAQPYCIIQPKDSRSVSASIKIIGFYNVKFAVRSGGHSPNPGFSAIGQSILLDMQKLDQVNLNRNKSVASIGPGARWGAVMTVMDTNAVAVVGGRLPTIGVGGLMLGGGVHYTSIEYGLAADNVKNYEVALSDGSIVNANSDENNDLFWALKGGGPNFGIVTRYDLNTKPIGGIWYQGNIYTLDQSSAVLEAFAEWQIAASPDLKANVGLVLGIDSVSVILIYSAPATQPASFAPFYAIKPALVAIPRTNGTFGSLATLLDGILGAGTPERHDYRTATARIDAQFYKDVFAYWLERAIAVHNATGANQTFTIEHISSNTAQQGILNGGNPMNIPQENQAWWETLIDWANPEDDDLVRSVSIDTTQQWNILARERGLDLPFVYMDHSSRDQSPLDSYGSENVAKLKAISRRYDTTQLFQTLQNNGFLLSHLVND